MRLCDLSFGVFLCACVSSFAAQGIYQSPPLSPKQRVRQTSLLDRRWQRFQKAYAGIGCRELFAFALESAEADYHPERIEPALALAEQMQDRDPARPTTICAGDGATSGRWIATPSSLRCRTARGCAPRSGVSKVA